MASTADSGRLVVDDDDIEDKVEAEGVDKPFRGLGLLRGLTLSAFALKGFGLAEKPTEVVFGGGMKPVEDGATGAVVARVDGSSSVCGVVSADSVSGPVVLNDKLSETFSPSSRLSSLETSSSVEMGSTSPS